jgi:hypothetical protein
MPQKPPVGKGGKREGAGRKTKFQEMELIKRLTPLDDVAFAALEKGVRAGDYPFVRMFFEYRFGKPKESVTIDDNSVIRVTWDD